MRSIILATIGFCLPSTLAAQTIDDLVDFVAGMPRGTLGIPAYWFEMETLVGWERMILVIGYANNRSTCELIEQIGTAQSPNQSFRCTPAN